MALEFKLNISGNITTGTEKTFYSRADKEIAGISLNRDIIGTEEIIAVLKELGHTINVFAARAVASIMTDLLAMSQPTVPIDTGKLRESGTALLEFVGLHYAINIAKGKKDGSVENYQEKIKGRVKKGVTGIIGDVTYFRLGDDGETDVSIFTHEYLNPYGSKNKPKARTPGTGPKYLENAWNKRKNDYLAFFKDALSGGKFERDLSKLLRKRSKQVRGYTLNYKELIHIM